MLEIGCGTGYSTYWLLIEQGYRVIAIEKNSACIAMAKEINEPKWYNRKSSHFYWVILQRKALEICCCQHIHLKWLFVGM